MGGGPHPELSQGMVGGGLPRHLLQVMTTCQTLVTGKDWGAAGSGAHRTNIRRNRLEAVEAGSCLQGGCLPPKV